MSKYIEISSSNIVYNITAKAGDFPVDFKEFDKKDKKYFIKIYSDDDNIKEQINDVHYYINKMTASNIPLDKIHVSALRKDNKDGYFGMLAKMFIKTYPITN